MKHFSLLMMFALLASGAMAQKNLLKGKITDKNQNPLAFATVILEGTVRGVQSDVNGNYELKDFPKGDYQLKISLLGYEDSVLPFSITEAETKILNIVMTEEPLWLDSFELLSSRGILGQEKLAEVEDFRINAGKKNEVIRIRDIDANLAMNNSRQIFGRTPGISIWENDGSGIQLGVASRGLSPNRSWEFNVRMNGYDITPDPMGYPEAYFTPPMEVVEKIEIIRGASSLQFGPQFGGLMNFVLRKPDQSTRFTVETINTLGNNGLFSTFNYIGGTEGKFSYTAYYQKRVGNGWRENGYFNTDHAHIEVGYAASNRLKLGLEATYMTTESQQPGGLTDQQFAEDSRQSTRERNWFSTPWFVPSLSAEYLVSPKTRLSWKVFGTIAERNSVGFVRQINEEDDLGNRQVDRDYYTTYGSELRLSTDFKFLGLDNSLASGIRYFNGHIDRKQNGVGSNGSEMDFELTSGSEYPRNLDFRNVNYAAFAENVFRFSDKFLLTAGLRLEQIESSNSGQFNVVNGQPQILDPITRTRSFLLAGLGSEFHVTPTTELYSNWSQAYRPVLISDLTPPATTDVIDQNLKDSRGFNFDFGYRGNIGTYLNFDVSYFYLNYADRIGTLTQLNSDGSSFQFRTNLGGSISQGFEGYMEVDPISAIFDKSRFGYLNIFASIAFVDARYGDFATTRLVNGFLQESNLKGNRVENAPRKINRYGATYRYRSFSMTWQLSDIGEAFADASNTLEPNAAATTGLIPAYVVQDLSASFTFMKKYSLKAGVNNLTDERYFTRRAGGYPGPGIMPADGRTFYTTLGLKF
ncbi:TonB-dependent receptor [Algoriphagus boritolerans]|uniref:Fe(3+) dicitrate transport protein n=1 Tax=Algoriphagus boritolerans DSM 17298 = JCM 18970 TaxID=1120964 RepID=A0A1H5ZGW3_9BACT|nr:TonB-dependent receptor [Algoriphagus boritolerans]SEG35482.1 Fe(3+) dicitrate transport protein [Algoriphagus boritolerans DSM 17298 = JCM 18970]